MTTLWRDEEMGGWVDRRRNDGFVIKKKKDKRKVSVSMNKSVDTIMSGLLAN